MDCDKIVGKLEERLFEIARGIIQDNHRLPDDYKQRFLVNPDSINEHEPNWHQWGIITHSKNFRKLYDGEVVRYLKNWELEESLKNYLQEEIDGISKAELIRISIPLHDIGKFRKGLKRKGEKVKFDFKKHDKIGQEIILNFSFRGMFRNYGLTDTHIEYVAKCVGNHYELGFVRDIAKESNLGYTLKFTQNPYFSEIINSRLSGFRGFEPEVGLLFLADSLAKTDVVIPAETDAEINQYTLKAKQEMRERNLNPQLIEAIRQGPVNIAVSREYLNKVL